MFNPPAYPDVYITRHITCVSCQEKFVVTEGHQAKKQDESEWRVRPNVPSTVNLYYEDRRQQRPVVPLPGQTPLPPENRINAQRPYAFTPYPINCPRCGADNRNWMALNNTSGMPQLAQWRLRFPGVSSTIPLGLAFMALALVLIAQFEIHISKAAVMLLFIPASILGVIWEITREWNALRENQQVRRILPQSTNKEAHLWARGVALVFLFTIVLPIVFFSMAPAAFRMMQELIDEPVENEVNVAATAVSQQLAQQIDATEENFAAIAAEMQRLINDLPAEDLPQLEAEIETLSLKLADTVALSESALAQLQVDSAAAIQARRNAEVEAVLEARDSALADLPDGLVADMKFLSTWAIVVGIPTLVTVFIAMAAVKGFVNRVDRDLPPPVFYSVANMTRLVTWEARQSLEIADDYFFHVQWMSVDRNEEGGLDLVGLFREPPEFDIFGQTMSPRVRAQKYTISTNKWCRIIGVKIEDALVPIPATVHSETIRSPRLSSSPPAPPSSVAMPHGPAPSSSPQPALTPIVIGPQRT